MFDKTDTSTDLSTDATDERASHATRLQIDWRSRAWQFRRQALAGALSTITIVVAATLGATMACAREGALNSSQKSANEAAALPDLALDPSSVTVSGLSSGAFMAVQLHVAHSRTFNGVAAIAGGLYGCARGSSLRAIDPCMASPFGATAKDSIALARKESEAGRIDPLKELADDKVFIFSGKADHVVHAGMATKLRDFYRSFVPEAQIRIRTDHVSAHGWPTVGFGESCVTGGTPYLLKCGFDLSGELLQVLYGPLQPPVDAIEANLTKFNQREFASVEAGMYPEGAIYVPAACRQGGSQCRLHLALHGCRQNPDFIADDFRRETGLNRWAEANGIVVLYPTVAKSEANDRGCWDWFGYSSRDYAVKGAPQMQAIIKMVQKLLP